MRNIARTIKYSEEPVPNAITEEKWLDFKNEIDWLNKDGFYNLEKWYIDRKMEHGDKFNINLFKIFPTNRNVSMDEKHGGSRPIRGIISKIFWIISR